MKLHWYWCIRALTNTEYTHNAEIMTITKEWQMTWPVQNKQFDHEQMPGLAQPIAVYHSSERRQNAKQVAAMSQHLHTRDKRRWPAAQDVTWQSAALTVMPSTGSADHEPGEMHWPRQDWMKNTEALWHIPTDTHTHTQTDRCTQEAKSVRHIDQCLEVDWTSMAYR